MRSWPWVTLLLLAPLLGEVVSGSTPPVRALNPVGAILLIVLYGGGALLAREYTVLWRKGWRTLLTLGVAYAIVEEGLMCKSFFDPGWPDVGKLGWYGRAMGVNWVWTYLLTVYHTAWSVGASVLIAELLHPEARGKPWLRPWARYTLMALLSGDVAVGYYALRTPVYRPGAPLYLGACVVVAALIVLAYRVRAEEPVRPAPKRLPPWRFGLLGFLCTAAFIPASYAASDIAVSAHLPPALYIALAAAFTFWLGRKLWRHSGAGRDWDDRHRAAFAAGALCDFALWDFLLSAMGSAGGKPMTGMGLVGLAVLALAWALVYEAKRRHRTANEVEGAATGLGTAAST